MSKNLTFNLVMVLSIASGLLVEETHGRLREPGAKAGSLPLVVRLYDYVDITPEIRDRALSGAADIFRRAGIDAQFLNCHATTTRPVVDDACNARLSPWELVARIVPRGMYPKLSRPSETYGVALTRGENPHFLWVLYDNVEHFAFKRRTESNYSMIHRTISHEDYVGILLAYALSHEVGHLLLGSKRHARDGVMKAQWSPDDLARAVTNHLHFQDRQVREMRRNLIHRLTPVEGHGP